MELTEDQQKVSDFVQSLFGNKPEKAAAPAKKATNAEQVVTFFKNKG